MDDKDKFMAQLINEVARHVMTVTKSAMIVAEFDEDKTHEVCEAWMATAVQTCFEDMRANYPTLPAQYAAMKGKM